MATSSITKNFIISDEEQAEKFINAIEESYKESLYRTSISDIKINRLKGSEEIKKFMERRNK